MDNGTARAGEASSHNRTTAHPGTAANAFLRCGRNLLLATLGNHADHQNDPAKIRHAGLSDILGSAGVSNVQGETQQKLDVYANQALLQCLGLRDTVAILVSEENEEPVTFDRAKETGKYVIFFDPLDGSSNIDVNVSVGTIFAVFPGPAKTTEDVNAAVLQPGCKQIAAGYVL